MLDLVSHWLLCHFDLLIVINGLTLGSIHLYYNKKKPLNVQNRFIIEKRTVQFLNVFAYLFFVVYFLYVIDYYEEIVVWIKDWLNDLTGHS